MFTTEEKYSNRYCNWFKPTLRLTAFVLLSLAAQGAVFAKEGSAGYSCPPPQYRYIHPSTLPNGTQGMAYSQQLFFNAGYGADRWSIVAGALPAGLTLNGGSGLLSGTPTAVGTYNFTVRVEKVSYSCVAQRTYTVVVKASATTALIVSASPATAGQAITLTAQVSAPLGGTPTGTMQFKVNGSPVSSPVLLFGDTASLNITAPAGGNQGYFTVSASYSGDGNFWPSSDSLTITVFDFSVQDDATGDLLLFNSNGTYLFKHCAGESSLVLRGRGVLLPSASACNVFLEHITADRELTAEVNTCEHMATARVVYQGAVYTLSDSDTNDNPNTCEFTSLIHRSKQ